MWRADRGFTLIESLVAIIVLAAAVSTILMLVSSNAVRQRDAAAKWETGLIAQSILDRVGLDVPLQVRTTSGVLASGARWKISIRPYAEPGFVESDNQHRLLAVSVEVSNPDMPRNSTELRTLMLAQVVQ